jgi:hypothetical protein
MNEKKKNQMKNCSTKNFTNKMETYLDFNQKYKILKEISVSTKDSYMYH